MGECSSKKLLLLYLDLMGLKLIEVTVQVQNVEPVSQSRAILYLFPQVMTKWDVDLSLTSLLIKCVVLDVCSVWC
jgi:hypothetical protein